MRKTRATTAERECVAADLAANAAGRWPKRTCTSASPAGPTAAGAACFTRNGLAQKHELHFASRKFNTIEINGSFYSLQRPSSYEVWHVQSPPGFVFSVKGPRFVTHMKKLRDVQAPVANFFGSGVLALREKLVRSCGSSRRTSAGTSNVPRLLRAAPARHRGSCGARHACTTTS
jgi:hypothetical protein